MTLSAHADQVLAELRRQVDETGGTARRPFRVLYALELSDTEFRSAVNELVDAGKIEVDEETGAVFGWVYLVPLS